MRLDEIGDMAAADSKIKQAEDVCGKHGDEHNVEYLLPGVLTAGHVLLRSECGIEGLILRVIEDIFRVVPVWHISESAFYLWMKSSMVRHV